MVRMSEEEVKNLDKEQIVLKDIDEVSMFSWDTKTKEFWVLGHKFDGVNSIEDFVNYIYNLDNENRQLKIENSQLKSKLEMQKGSNKLLCKAIMCDNCDCDVVCEAHKQQIKLQEQLQQRDEVIKEAIKMLDNYQNNLYSETARQTLDDDVERTIDILNKYKNVGD